MNANKSAILLTLLLFGVTHASDLRVTSSSGRSAALVEYDTLAIGDEVFFDRSYKFTDIGDYGDNCYYLKGSNDDKKTPVQDVQWVLNVPFDSTVYIDLWGGSNHGFDTTGWTLSDDRPSTQFDSVYGPGVVYEKNFPAGTINLLGNGESHHGTYYAFICPQDLRVTSSSGRSAALVGYDTLAIGDKVFFDRSYEFTDIGDYEDNCYYLKGSNDDKQTPAQDVQWVLHVPFDSTVYIDLWGRSLHGFDTTGWTLSDDRPSTQFDSVWGGGPGLVYEKNFPAGTINLLGNGESGHGTYYAFICPQVKSWSCPISGRSPGTSLGQVFVSSMYECKKSCESVEGCKAIIFRKSTGLCWRLDRFYEGKYEKVSDDRQVANYGIDQTCDDCLTAVTELYETLLCRDPDSGGLNHYTSKCESGEKDIDEIRADILASAEYANCEKCQNNCMDNSAFWDTCRWQTAQDPNIASHLETNTYMGWTCLDNEILTGFGLTANDNDITKVQCCSLGGHSSVKPNTCSYMEVEGIEAGKAFCGDNQDHMVFSGAYDKRIRPGAVDAYTEILAGKCCEVDCDAGWCANGDWGVDKDDCTTVSAQDNVAQELVCPTGTLMTEIHDAKNGPAHGVQKVGSVKCCALHVVAAPTVKPTFAPSTSPTTAPTPSPTKAPTTAPSPAPTSAPSVAPTKAPTTVKHCLLENRDNAYGDVAYLEGLARCLPGCDQVPEVRRALENRLLNEGEFY